MLQWGLIKFSALLLKRNLSQLGKQLILLIRDHGNHLPIWKVLLLLPIGRSLALGVHEHRLRCHEVGGGIESRRVLEVDDREALSIDHRSVVVLFDRHRSLPLVLLLWHNRTREVTHTCVLVAGGWTREELIVRE